MGRHRRFIDRRGYGSYARANVEAYRSWLCDEPGPAVVVLSSGFMTYPLDVHPEYARLRREIESSAATVALLPSFDRDICVTEIVRRQGQRSFARAPAREAAVIRERFPVYMGLACRKVETMGPPGAVVDALLASLRFAG